MTLVDEVPVAGRSTNATGWRWGKALTQPINRDMAAQQMGWLVDKLAGVVAWAASVVGCQHGRQGGCLASLGNNMAARIMAWQVRRRPNGGAT